MKEIESLLNQRWILKKDESPLYFMIKDNFNEISSFLKEKLGYAVVINPIMAKIDKTPGSPKSWMGIIQFDSSMCYIFLCYALIFLENLDPDEQFVLSQLTDYISDNCNYGDKVDWTIYYQRKSLVKVLAFLKDEGMLLLSDGDDNLFSSSESSNEVLYENTGASRYFMRRFTFDISGFSSYRDFIGQEWYMDDQDRGISRRHRVYRKLVMEPVVYREGDDDSDYVYIRNQRSVIQYDMENYLGAGFHLHKNGAMVFFEKQSDLKDSFPSLKNISDIALQVCCEIRKRVKSGGISLEIDDTCVISKVAFKDIISSVRDNNVNGWSKQYRELAQSKLESEILEIMTDFGMLEYIYEDNEIKLLPIIGKINGSYPDEFLNKNDNKVNEI